VIGDDLKPINIIFFNRGVAQYPIVCIQVGNIDELLGINQLSVNVRGGFFSLVGLS
jgi:hypothetical protein